MDLLSQIAYYSEFTLADSPAKVPLINVDLQDCSPPIGIGPEYRDFRRHAQRGTRASGQILAESTR